MVMASPSFDYDINVNILSSEQAETAHPNAGDGESRIVRRARARRPSHRTRAPTTLALAAIAYPTCVTSREWNT